MRTPKRAEFLSSAGAPGRFPRPELPEVAIAGRSNVGKSSLINALTGVSSLARTSRDPGRTRLLNWFRIQPQKGPPFCLVDLPGYGYAKVSKQTRASWQPLIESYLKDRSVLRAVIVLIDVRRRAQTEERELLEWLEQASIPGLVVLTKADKLAKSKRKLAAQAIARELGLKRPPILSSAETGEGLESLWRLLTGAVAGEIP